MAELEILQDINELNSNIETANTKLTEIDNLTQKVNVLNDDRGYLTSVVVNDANDIRQNGKYILTYTSINKPDNGTDWYVCDATFEILGTTGRLIATCYAGVNMGKTYTRINLHGTWNDWQEIATTTKTPFTCTAGTGFTILFQDCYKLNGEFVVNLEVKKTDETAFSSVSHNIVATLPFTPTYTSVGTCKGRSAISVGMFTNLCTSWISGNGLLVNCVADTKIISITLRGVV